MGTGGTMFLITVFLWILTFVVYNIWPLDYLNVSLFIFAIISITCGLNICDLPDKNRTTAIGFLAAIMILLGLSSCIILGIKSRPITNIAASISIVILGILSITSCFRCFSKIIEKG